MSFDPLDPNRYAEGLEAQSVMQMAEIERADVELARKRQALAQETYRTIEQRFKEAEAAYKRLLVAKDDAFSYMERASSHLDTSIERLATTNAPLHPVRKTPLEILGYIFEFCLEYLPETGCVSEKSSNIRKRQLQPFYVAAVCRRWRYASLACPQAWTAIDLQLDDVSGSNAPHWKGFLASFLERSSTRLLDIRIIRKSPDNGFAGRLVPLIRDALERCGSLLVSTSDIDESGDIMAHILTTSTPSLRSLHFLTPREVSCDMSYGIFPEASTVRTVRTSFPALFDYVDLPNVDSVVLCTPQINGSDDDLAGLVDAQPKQLGLVNAHFQEVAVEDKENLLVQVLKVSQYRAHGHLEALANCYSFPNLHMVHLWGNTRTVESRIMLLAQIAPSAPSLRTVIIDTVEPSNLPDLLAALRRVQRLTALHIKAALIDSAGLTELCDTIARPSVRADGKTAWFCPLLEHLLLSFSTFAPDCAQEKLFELVERRLRGATDTEAARRPRALRNVTLPVSTDADIKARVKELLSAK